MSIVSVLHRMVVLIFEVLTTKMAGRVAFGKKTRYLFRQMEGTIMGIDRRANFLIFVKFMVAFRGGLFWMYGYL